MSASKVDRELFNELLYCWNYTRYREYTINRGLMHMSPAWFEFQKNVDDELDQIFSQRESIGIFGYENYEKLLEGTTSTFVKDLDYSDFLRWMHSKFWPIVECMDKDAKLSLADACKKLWLTVPAQDIFEHWKNYDPPGSEPPRPKRMASRIMTSFAQFKSAMWWREVSLWKHRSDEKPPIIVPIALGQPAGTEVKFRLCMNENRNCRWLAPKAVRGSYPGVECDGEEDINDEYHRSLWANDPNDHSEDRLFVLGNLQCEEDSSSSTFNELFAGYQLGYLECMKVDGGGWEKTNLAAVLRKQCLHPQTSGQLYVIDEEKLAGKEHLKRKAGTLSDIIRTIFEKLAGKEHLKRKAGTLSDIIRTIFEGRVWINVDEENDYHLENAAEDGLVKDNMGSIEAYRAESTIPYIKRWHPNQEPRSEWDREQYGWVTKRERRGSRSSL